ncbi:MAG: AraC family transcriptional regulator [Lentisphaeria bacterium]
MMDNLVKAIGLEHAKAPYLRGRARTLPFHAVIYLLGGTGTFRDAQTPEQSVGPGTVFCIAPGVAHCYDPLPGTVWTEYWVLFDGAAAEARFGPLWPAQSLLVCGILPELTAVYEELYRYQQERRPDTPVLGALGLHRLLGLLYLQLQRRESSPLLPALAAAVAAMQRQLGRPSVNLPVIARQHRISFETLRKQFRRQTGRAPHAYFLNLKLEAAKNLLLLGRGVKGIAGELGFADPYYFSRLFKRHCGLSPSRFAAGHRRAPP